MMEMFLKRLSEKYFLADYKRPPFRVRDGVFYTGNGKELFAYRNSLYFSDKKVQDLNRQILVLCLVITGLIFPIGFVARQLFSTAAILIVMILLLGVVAFAFSAKNIWLRSKVRNGAKLYKSFEKSEFRSYSLSQVVIESSVPFWMVAVLPMSTLFFLLLTIYAYEKVAYFNLSSIDFFMLIVTFGLSLIIAWATFKICHLWLIRKAYEKYILPNEKQDLNNVQV